MLENFTGNTSSPKVGDVGFYAFPDQKSKRMIIFRVIPGSPADKAGIQRGDFLVGIEGELIENMGFNALLRKLQGDPGSNLKVATSRGGVLARHELKREVMVNKPLAAH
jgi:carboxyl-terminal processing protease